MFCVLTTVNLLFPYLVHSGTLKKISPKDMFIDLEREEGRERERVRENEKERDINMGEKRQLVASSMYPNQELSP